MNAPVENQTQRIKGEVAYLFIDDGGTGALPLVFTHSFGGYTMHWKYQLEYFRPDWRSIAFDFRGHGKSVCEHEPSFTVEALAGDIVAVADGLDLEKFVLIGHSMGGSASIAYADSHPNRVAGILLVGTPGRTPKEIAEPVLKSLYSDAYHEVMDDYMEGLLASAKPEVRKRVSQGVRNLSKQTSINCIRALFEFDPIDKLQRFKGPVLIVGTDNDEKLPNALQNQMPGVARKIIQGTSHWPQLDKPAEFNTILADFLINLKLE